MSTFKNEIHVRTMPVKSVTCDLHLAQPNGRIVDTHINYMRTQDFLDNFMRKTDSTFSHTELHGDNVYIAYKSSKYNRDYVVIVFDSGFAIDN